MPERIMRTGWMKAAIRVFVFIFIFSLTNIAAPLLADTTVVQGQVTYPGSTAAQGVSVELHTPDGIFNATTTTDASGNYAIVSTLTSGFSYVLEVRAPDGYNHPSNSPTNFTYTTGDATRTVNFQLVAANKVVTGMVTNPDGTAVTNADINIDPADTNGGQLNRVAARTDNTGHYTADVQAGTWFAQAVVNLSEQDVHWIAEQPPVELTFTGTDAETRTVNFEVTPATGNLKVVLLNSDGNKLTTSNFVADIDVKRADGVGTVRKVAQADSSLNIFLTPGIYHMCAFHMDLTGKSFAPADTTFTMPDNGTVDLGTVSAQVDSAHLKGKVTDTSGKAIGGIQLQALNETGCNRPAATTDSSGNFDITVGAGNWTVGLATTADPVKSQIAPATATVANGATVSGLSISLRTIDGTVTGSVVNASGTVITDFVGSAYMKNAKGTARVSAPVVDGTYRIRFPSADFSGSLLVGAIADPGSGYGDAKEAKVTVVNNTGVKNVTVKIYDATIVGTVQDSSGTVITNSGSDITVYATDTDGNFVSAPVSDTDGTYSLLVGAGVWSLNYDITDPDTTTNLLDRPAGADSVTAKSNQTVTKNLTVVKGTNTITGTVKDKNGTLLKSVNVTIDNRGSLENSASLNQNKIVTTTISTDENGVYTEKVPDGTYMITVGDTPDVDSTQIQPDGKSVKVSGSTTKTVNFTFEATSATLSGTIKMSGKANGGGTITAYSTDGGQQSTTVGSNGKYTLNVTKGEKWSVVVTDLSGKTLAASDAVDITPKAGKNTLNLTMTDTGERVFGPVTKSFDASEEGSVSLPDGTTVTVPERALGISGTVSLTVTPVINGNPTGGDIAAGLTYEVKATDPDGNELKTLNRPATITIPYPQQAVEEKGLREKSLSTKFFNPETEQWEDTPGFVDLTDNVAKLTTNHFSQFSVTGATRKKPTVSTVKVKSVAKTSIVVEVNGANYAGKVTATLGTVTASKVTVTGTKLTITFPSKNLKAGKQTLTITNGDGRTITKTSAVNVTKKGSTVTAAGLKIAPHILRYVQ